MGFRDVKSQLTGAIDLFGIRYQWQSVLIESVQDVLLV
jgi:hypothetical protein